MTATSKVGPAAPESSAAPVLISACLLGLRCRYDGSARRCPEVAEALDGRLFVPVCPEELGGLSTPRPANTIAGSSDDADGRDVLAGAARVLDSAGADRTAEFLRGSEETLGRALAFGCREAWLKGGSPSCGALSVSRGEGPGRRKGLGAAAAALERAGVALREFD